MLRAMNETELIDAVERAAESEDKRVKVSLAGVSFMSSGMITSFLNASKYAKPLGVEIRFVNASPNVIEVFKITKMNRLFRIEGEAE